MKQICEFCKEEYEVSFAYFSTRKYCSATCRKLDAYGKRKILVAKNLKTGELNQGETIFDYKSRMRYENDN